jgi:PST family polysaccharide transporter
VRREAAQDQADTSYVARGTRHTAVSQLVTQLVRFGTNVALARLLTPDEFGVFVIALVMSMLIDQIKDLGTGAAIIQRESVDDKLLNSVFYLNLALGIVLAGGMYLTAEPLASLLGNPRAAPVLQVFSAITLVTSLGQIHFSLLRREQRFFDIAVMTTVGATTNAVVTVGAALLGLGYWAPVLGVGAGAVVGMTMVWVYGKWRPSLVFSITSIRSIWSYSIHLVGSNVLLMLFNQLDKVIISRFLGSAPLGVYTLAQRTVTSPMTAISSVVAEVCFPVFSRLQEDLTALRSGFLRATRVVALVTFPAMAGLAVLADPVVRVVFGMQWLGLIPVIWLLAPIAAVQSLTANAGHLALATGHSKLLYRMGLVNLIVIGVLELVAVQWGLVAVAAAFAAGTLLLAPMWLALTFRTIGLGFGAYLRALVPHLWITAAMAAAAAGAAYGVGRAGGPAWLELVVGVLVGVAMYGLLVWKVRPPALTDALSVLSIRLKPRTAP